MRNAVIIGVAVLLGILWLMRRSTNKNRRAGR